MAAKVALRSVFKPLYWPCHACLCSNSLTNSKRLFHAADVSQPLSSGGSANIATSGSVKSVGPSVRLLLTLYDIAPDRVTATGPHRRLLKGDVLEYITRNKLEPRPVQAIAQAPISVEVPVEPTPPRLPAVGAQAGQHEDVEFLDLELTSMRKAIAKRVTQSKRNVPHLYAFSHFLTSNMKEVRQALAADGVKVSMNDFIVKACAAALQRMPAVNSRWTDGEIHSLSTVDIAVAVATPTGLLTPIVTEANVKSLAEISSNVKDLATRAKDGRVRPDETHGGSFTVSNLGMFGVKEFVAVLNPPQAAALSVGCEEATICEGIIGSTINIALTFDGRVLDEQTAARFLTLVKELLESPTAIGV